MHKCMFEGEVLQRCNTHVKIADKFTGEIKKIVSRLVKV